VHDAVELWGFVDGDEGLDKQGVVLMGGGRGLGLGLGWVWGERGGGEAGRVTAASSTAHTTAQVPEVPLLLRTRSWRALAAS